MEVGAGEEGWSGIGEGRGVADGGIGVPGVSNGGGVQGRWELSSFRLPLETNHEGEVCERQKKGVGEREPERGREGEGMRLNGG